MKMVLGVIGVLALGMGIGWLAEGNDFLLYKTFAPKQEQVRREVFEQSKAYNQGTIQELQNMEFQYEQADDAHRAALASIILHRAADYDEARLPGDLRVFLVTLRHSRQVRQP